MADSALGRLRILDFSRVLAGPLATMTLADLGAEVTKVERPGRRRRHPLLGPAATTPTARRPTSRRSTATSAASSLDLADAERPGRGARAWPLAADVVVENFRPGRDGCGSASATRRSPPRTRGLVYCSITGFGGRGAGADAAGLRPARPGARRADERHRRARRRADEGRRRPRRRDRRPLRRGRDPRRARAPARERRGPARRGRPALVPARRASSTRARPTPSPAPSPGRMGNATRGSPPTSCTPPRRELVSRRQRPPVPRARERSAAPELADDPRFATNPARVEHRDALLPLLAAALAALPAAEWVELLSARRVPAGVVNDVGAAFALRRADRARPDRRDPPRGGRPGPPPAQPDQALEDAHQLSAAPAAATLTPVRVLVVTNFMPDAACPAARAVGAGPGRRGAPGRGDRGRPLRLPLVGGTSICLRPAACGRCCGASASTSSTPTTGSPAGSAKLAGAAPLIVTFHGTDVRHHPGRPPLAPPRLAPGPRRRGLAGAVRGRGRTARACRRSPAPPSSPAAPTYAASSRCRGPDARRQLGLDPEGALPLLPRQPGAAGEAPRPRRRGRGRLRRRPPQRRLDRARADAALAQRRQRGPRHLRLRGLRDGRDRGAGLRGAGPLHPRSGSRPTLCAESTAASAHPSTPALGRQSHKATSGASDRPVAGSARAATLSAAAMAERAIVAYRAGGSRISNRLSTGLER